MRSLDDTEKKIVNDIIKYSQSEEGLENNVINILKRILSKGKKVDSNKAILKYNLKKGRVWIEKEYKDSENNSTNSIIENVVPIAKIISCMDYLEKMNLISFVEYYYEEDLEDTSQIDMSDRSDYQEIKDDKIKKFIFDNMRSGIFDTEHLRDYSKDYKTVEQRRHEDEIKTMNKEIKWAIIAASIATFGIIVNVVISLIDLMCNRIH
ncbi:MAG: hypothetical protein FWC41_12580 [Firmicutes bacterium]|nr:hypothetical protein [Bacillota bacterium]